MLAGKLVKHYRAKHCDRDLPDGLLSRIPGMSHEELNTTLTQLVSADRTSCVRLSRSEGDNADSDGTQDLEVNLVQFSWILSSVLWMLRVNADVPDDCSRWTKLQRGSFVCGVLWLFSIQPGYCIHGWKDLPSGSMQDRCLLFCHSWEELSQLIVRKVLVGL